MIYLFLIFLLGVMTPIQTAANSRLRLSVGTPLVASLVSFSVGTIFLFCATMIEKGSTGIELDTIEKLPWWAWLGGMCGLYGLTVNIVIFPKLGSVQTALMPMLGQIVTGMLIDSFGWLRAPLHEFNLLRLVSIVLIVTGVVMVVGKNDSAKEKSSGLLLWKLLGFSGGAIFAFQPPMNSLLSASLSSATDAALISFLTATSLLLIIVVSTPENRKNIPAIFSFDRPWWSWLGGIVGGTFVTGFAFFTAKTGVGLLLVTSICGMLAMSLFIDKYGLLGAAVRKVGSKQYAGLLCVVSGIILLKLN